MDWDVIRYTIRKSANAGFDKIRLQTQDFEFEAEIDLDEEFEPEAMEMVNDEPKALYKAVTAEQVGVFRALNPEVSVSSRIEKGQKIGEIIALGLANDVVARTSGTVVEIVAITDTPVEFGQVLMKVEE